MALALVMLLTGVSAFLPDPPPITVQFEGKDFDLSRCQGIRYAST
ncbi:hypothetical protein [Xanthomonas fragariae]|nr:hypothetical protein [Xanthomonas fragariae]WAT14965.1 hypothetical protein OZ429_19145 [Xanthomonas fragariae]